MNWHATPDDSAGLLGDFHLVEGRRKRVPRAPSIRLWDLELTRIGQRNG